MMTSVSATTSIVSPARQASSDAAKSTLDYNAFLRLFIAQLKNQDPMKPNDPTQTLSQLASFSNVEQSIKLNEKLDSLVSSASATLAATMIGKGVSSLDGSMSGVVTAVENGPQGLIAVLDGGARLALSGGYKMTGA
jgi:flagellar basal-body rod modification protein FlgD